MATLVRARPAPKPPSNDPALVKLRAEAKAHGATLASGGEGGLPPQLVLQVIRRDGYKCPKCGGRENLSIHHKGRHLQFAAARLTKKSTLDPSGVTTMCAKCHDAVHQEDRAGTAPRAGDDPAVKRT